AGPRDRVFHLTRHGFVDGPRLADYPPTGVELLRAEGHEAHAGDASAGNPAGPDGLWHAVWRIGGHRGPAAGLGIAIIPRSTAAGRPGARRGQRRARPHRPVAL